jgi:hypothetical protein
MRPSTASGTPRSSRSTSALGRPLRSISYLPSINGEPQRFTYATTVAPRLTGTGESLGDRDRADGTRWSGLRFWAADRRSVID